MRVLRRVMQRLLLGLYRKRVSALLLLVLAVAGGEYYLWRNTQLVEAQSAGVFPVEVAVQPIQIRDEGQAVVFTLTLKEMNGNRRISMNINSSEALAIAKEKGPRIPAETPKAYELLRDTIQQMGGRVDRVIVNDADQRGYFAQVFVSTGADTRTVSARPGDATALALNAGAPIYVEDKVLEQWGTRGTAGAAR